MTSHNKIKPNESSFATVDYGASSGGYEHQGKRPSQNKIKPNEASGVYDGRDHDYMNPVRRDSPSHVKPNISSFKIPERRHMPRDYVNAGKRPSLNHQVRPNHASGNYNKKPESAYDKSEDSEDDY
ncbi:hypothetical protein QQ045_032551 [Rhodiola kirilowii]